jgi:hypothetical protein
MKNLFTNIRDWKTTLVGIVSMILMGLVWFKIIDAQTSDTIKQMLDAALSDLGGSTFAIIATVIQFIGSLLLLFVKDPNKPKTDTK